MNYLISNKLLTLKEQISVLKVKFRELKLLSYPENDIEKVIEYMDDLTSKFNERIHYYKSNSINNEELCLISTLINVFYKTVGYVVNCDTKNHPREIMIPIKEILNEMNQEHIFITEPKWELNYSVGKLITRNYKDALLKCGIHLDNDIEVIKLSFPKLHQDNILWGAIMAHELGHYLDLHYSLDLSEKIIVKMMNTVDIKKYLKYIYYSVDGFKFDEGYLKGDLPNIILRDWIEEVVADILGIIFYGISSYLASEHLSIFYSYVDVKHNKFAQQFSETHPRDSFRNYIRLATLSKLGYFSVLDSDLINKINEYKKHWDTSVTYSFTSYDKKIDEFSAFIVNNNYLMDLEKDIKANVDWIIDNIIEEIKKISPNLIYDSNRFKDEIPHLVEKIKKIIPPNENKGKPVDSISIINAGWVAYILHSDEIKNNVPNCEENNGNMDVKQVIDNLLKKATLSASIHRRWINATC